LAIFISIATLSYLAFLLVEYRKYGMSWLRLSLQIAVLRTYQKVNLATENYLRHAATASSKPYVGRDFKSPNTPKVQSS
jgi:hypothetical protein